MSKDSSLFYEVEALAAPRRSGACKGTLHATLKAYMGANSETEIRRRIYNAKNEIGLYYYHEAMAGRSALD